MARHQVEFGRFHLDLDQRKLSSDGAAVKLGSRALDILCVLASAEGDVVSKDKLMAEVWPGLVVEENNIQVHISALRKALEDRNDSYVVTVPGRGYRLIGLQRNGASGQVLESEPKRSPLTGATIAVLPFTNLSGDPGQDYFADGIVEDIITGLSRISWLFVIARNSSFVFRGKDNDLRKTGLELGCCYLVQGGVRKSGNRIRITAQLVDAETGVCLWAERYDRLLDDIFDVQDEIAMSLIGALEPNLKNVETERVKRKRPDNLDAYDLMLRALPLLGSFMPAGANQAIPLLQKVLELEPGYVAAHAHLARCFHIRYSRGGLRQEDRAASVRHARAAIIGSDDASALAMAALVLWFDDNDVLTAFNLFDRALSISRSNVIALATSAYVCAWMGEAELALERARHALQLSPFDTLIASLAIAVVEFHRERYREAHEAARRAVEANPQFSVSYILLAVVLVRLGRLDEARTVARRVMTLDPTFSMRAWAATNGKVPAVFDPFAEAWQDLDLQSD